MTYIEWDPTLETGNRLVDSQHRGLVRLMNELEVALSGEPGDEAVEGALFGLLRYVAVHFGEEEELMASMGYPQFEEHQTLHREFAADTQKVADGYLAGETGLPDRITELLHHWFVDHLLREDRRMIDWVNARSGAAAR